jgi:hypothetical protein
MKSVCLMTVYNTICVLMLLSCWPGVYWMSVTLIYRSSTKISSGVDIFSHISTWRRRQSLLGKRRYFYVIKHGGWTNFQSSETVSGQHSCQAVKRRTTDMGICPGVIYVIHSPRKLQIVNFKLISSDADFPCSLLVKSNHGVSCTSRLLNFCVCILISF